MKGYLGNKVETFTAGSIQFAYCNWECLTTDHEVLETVSGMHISLTSELPIQRAIQYNFNPQERKYIEQEINNLLKKGGAHCE